MHFYVIQTGKIFVIQHVSQRANCFWHLGKKDMIDGRHFCLNKIAIQNVALLFSCLSLFKFKKMSNWTNVKRQGALRLFRVGPFHRFK